MKKYRSIVVVIILCSLFLNSCSFIGYKIGKAVDNNENVYIKINKAKLQKDSLYIVTFNDNSQIRGTFNGYNDSLKTNLIFLLKLPTCWINAISILET